MAEELGAREVKLQMDSRLMVSQIKGEYQARPDLARYLALVKEKMSELIKSRYNISPRTKHSSRYPVQLGKCEIPGKK
jgi:ribonuclease HI